MSSTTEPSAARRFAIGDSASAATSLYRSPLIFGHGQPPGFGCVHSAESRRVMRVVVTGELDIATTPQLRAALSTPADGTVLVILDLSEVAFIDATGLGVILSAHGQLRDADCRFVVIPGPRAVQRLFEITDTEHQLDFRKASDAKRLVASLRPGEIRHG